MIWYSGKASDGTKAATDFEPNKLLFATIKTADRLLLPGATLTYS